MSTDWIDWTPVEPTTTFTPRALAELLDGGQAFGWWPQPDGSWLGRWTDRVAALRLGDHGMLQWCAPAPLAAALQTELPGYLGLSDVRQTAALDALPWRSDPHLATCLTVYPGLRILRQPFGETLLAFLCSATKQIVQIKQMLALLATRHGTPLPHPLPPACNPLGYKCTHRLPTWAQLAAVPESELRDCLLGFRARYIAGTAAYLAAHPGWLEATAALPYTEAKARLLTLPGVGEKIADCVALFGLGHLEAFPVDTWMLKAMARRYGLADWRPAQVAQFGRTHFGAGAGLAQQFLFAYERAAGQPRG